MPMMKEFDPYIKCPWCGREIHCGDYMKHMCPKKRAAWDYLGVDKLTKKLEEHLPQRRKN